MSKRSRFLSTAFCSAAVTFMGIHWGSYALVTGDSEAELSDEIGAIIGMSRQALQDYAKSPFLILDPTHKNTRRFFETSLNAPPDSEIMSGTSMNAQAQQNSIYGHGSTIDKLSGGISGALQPCLVVLNPDRITIKNVKNLAAPSSPDQMTNVPGTDADYLKLVTLHELEHCTHATTDPERTSQEYRADRRTLQKFLDDGGDANVVQAWISVRSMAALRNALLGIGDGRDDPYTMAPVLYDEFVAGNTEYAPASLEKLQLLQIGYSEAAYEIIRMATQKQGPSYNLRDPNAVYHITRQVLNDSTRNISDDARSVLQMNMDAYEFLTRPQKRPQPRPSTTPLPAPGVS
jgi:hypothetical protein